MALTFSAKALIDGTHTKVFEGQTVSNKLTFTYSKPYTDGSAIDQCSQVWIDKARNLNATTEEIDVAAALTDAYGSVVSFAKIKVIYIKNLNTVAGETLKVGGAAANAFLLFDDATDIYTIGPDGVFFISEPSVAAKTVTAATGDLLKLDAGAANINYDILIAGW